MGAEGERRRTEATPTVSPLAQSSPTACGPVSLVLAACATGSAVGHGGQLLCPRVTWTPGGVGRHDDRHPLALTGPSVPPEGGEHTALALFSLPPRARQVNQTPAETWVEGIMGGGGNAQSHRPVAQQTHPTRRRS